MTTNAERLGKAVRERRDELGLNQLEVSQAGGPSNTKMTEIENDRLEDLSNVVAKRLDAGLQWEPGTARKIWRGEFSPLEELRRHILAAPIPDAAKEHMLATLEDSTTGEVGDDAGSAAM